MAALSRTSELMESDRVLQGATIAAAFVILTMFDTQELVCLVLGAGALVCLHASQRFLTPKTFSKAKVTRKLEGVQSSHHHAVRHKPAEVSKSHVWRPCSLATALQGPAAQHPAPEAHRAMWTPSCTAAGFEVEVGELVESITPTEACEATVQQLVCYIRSSITKSFPAARVSGFVMGRLSKCNCAYAVAVPDVEIIIDIHQPRCGRSEPRTFADLTSWRKRVLRKCAGRLVQGAGFKFRRSTFGSVNPKVTLMLPPGPGNNSNEPLPITISANSATPSHVTRLHYECREIDARSMSLVLLVRRWAKDRGISHAARGNLSPCGWTMLAIYYLQRGTPEGPILPSFWRFKVGGAESVPRRRANSHAEPMAVAELFKDFFRFFCEEVDWEGQVVSIHAACGEPRARQPGAADSASLPLVIEDPFDTANVLTADVTSQGFARTLAELRRAHDVCSKKASLSELLEPYVPTEGEQVDELTAFPMDDAAD